MAPTPSCVLGLMLVITAYHNGVDAKAVDTRWPLLQRIAREMAMGSSVRDRDSQPPRNVALFLAHLPSHEAFKSAGKTSFPVYEEFPVQDTLQACVTDSGSSRGMNAKNPFPTTSESNHSFVSPNSNGVGSGYYSHGKSFQNGVRSCQSTLDENLDSLINWAGKVNGMATGVVSTLNSSDDQFRARMKRRDSVVGVTSRFFGDKSTVVGQNPEVIGNYDGSSTVGSRNTIGDIDPANEMFQAANKMRQMFMGSFMHSLARPKALNSWGPLENGMSASGFPPTNQRGFGGEDLLGHDNDARPPLSCLVQSTLNNLKGAADSSGFLNVVKAEGRVDPIDLDNSIRQVIDQTNPIDTLIVVASLCPDGSTVAPDRLSQLKVYAKGPNCYVIRNCRSLCDLPMVIKDAIRHRDTISTADDDKFRGLSPDRDNALTRYRESSNVTGSSARFPFSSFGTSDDKIDTVHNKFGDNRQSFCKEHAFNHENDDDRETNALNGHGSNPPTKNDHRIKELPEHYHHAMSKPHPKDMDQNPPKDKSRGKMVRIFEELLQDLHKHENNIDAILREQEEESNLRNDNSTVVDLKASTTTKSSYHKMGDAGLNKNNMPLVDTDQEARNSTDRNTSKFEKGNRFQMCPARPHSTQVRFPYKSEEKVFSNRTSTKLSLSPDIDKTYNTSRYLGGPKEIMSNGMMNVTAESLRGDLSLISDPILTQPLNQKNSFQDLTLQEDVKSEDATSSVKFPNDVQRR